MKTHLKNKVSEKISPTALYCLAIYLFTLGMTITHLEADYPLGWDAGEYLSHSKSLSIGKGYSDLSEPDSKKLFITPLGYPLILAMYWKIFGDIQIISVVNWLILCLIPIFVFLWLRNFLLEQESLLAALILSCHHKFPEVALGFISEGWFMFFLFSSLFVQQTKIHSKYFSGLVFYLSQVRSVGMAFLLVHLYDLAKNRKILVLGLIVGIWIAWVSVEKVWVFPDTNGGSNSGHLSRTYPPSEPLTALKNVWKNGSRNTWAITGSLFAKSLFPEAYHWVPMNFIKRGLVLGVFLFALWGMVLAWKKSRDLRMLIIGFAISMVPVLLWVRSDPLYRYIFPFFPLYILFLSLGIKKTVSFFITSKGQRYATPIFLSVILLNQIVFNFKYDHWFNKVEDKHGFHAALNFLSASQNKPDILLSPYKFYTYFKTGIHSTQFSYGHNIFFQEYSPEKQEIWALVGPSNEFLLKIYGEENKVLQRSELKTFGRWKIIKINGISDLRP